MHKIPGALISGLQHVAGFDEAAFINIHEQGSAVTSIRTNPMKSLNLANTLPFEKKIDWTSGGFYLSERPSFTFDPLFHAGAYYVQEASSMFLEQALIQTADVNNPLLVLDLCAAPGGKSTHLQSLINKNSVLVCNEVIRSRVNILLENITKWGASNCIITNNDPRDFTALENVFDVIVVDAPCSGSGLFRKDKDAIKEWSLNNVEHCCVRQQRIIEDAWSALKPGGVLIYSTCSYSPEEDELIADKITANFKATGIELVIRDSWGIVKTYSPQYGNPCYRFFPYLLDGEGFFIACFRKDIEEDNENNLKQFNVRADKRLNDMAAMYLSPIEQLQFYRHEQQLFAMPDETMQLFLNIQNKLNIRKAGIKIGDIVRDEIIPDHALALGLVYNKDIPVVELTNEMAIAYLRRQEFELFNAPRGRLMAVHNGLPLGWLKNIGNRINNYYPKEWRIRN